jgi:hypothetical protein
MVRKVDLYLVANVGTFSIASKMVVISAIECSAKSFSAWSSVNGDFIFATDGKFFLIILIFLFNVNFLKIFYSILIYQKNIKIKNEQRQNY